MGVSACLLDEIGLAREIALLDRLLVGEERRDVEVVSADLVVAVAELGLEKEPPADARVAAHHDRLAFQGRKAVVSDPLVRDQNRRILLERSRDRHHRDVILGEIERYEGIGGNAEFDAACRQKLRLVDLRPSLAQDEVDAVLLVDPGRKRLIIAAVFGFRLPVGPKRHLVKRSGTGRSGPERDNGSGDDAERCAHHVRVPRNGGCSTARIAAPEASRLH